MLVAPTIKNLSPERYQAFMRWFGRNIYSQLPIEERDNILILLENSSPEEVDQMISNLAKNVRRGIERGKLEGKAEIAINMFRKGYPIDVVLECTQLPIEELNNLLHQLKN